MSEEIISSFIQILSESKNIDEKEVTTLWNKIYNRFMKTNEAKKKETKSLKKIEEEPSTEDTNELVKCSYLYKRGKKAGQICGATLESGTICKSHKKHEATDKPSDGPLRNLTAVTGTCPYIFKRGEKANKPCGAMVKEGSVMCSKHASQSEKPVKEKKQVETGGGDKVFTKHRSLGVLYNSLNGFVLNDSKEVTGRIKKDKGKDKIYPLTEEDIEEATRLKYKVESLENVLKKIKESDIEDDIEEEKD